MTRKRTKAKTGEIPDVESPVVRPGKPAKTRKSKPRATKAAAAANSANSPAPGQAAESPPASAKRPRGRRAKPGTYLEFFRPKNVALTEQLLADICEALESGLSGNQVRKIFEIPRGTWSTWHTTSKDQTAKDPVILTFFERTQAAAERGRYYALRCVREAMPDDWRAAAWYLERSDPARWQPRNKQEHHHSGQINGKLSVDYSKKLPAPEAVQDRILEMAAGIAQRRGGVPHLSVYRGDDEPQILPMNGHANGHASNSNGHHNGHHNGQNGNGHTNGSNGHH